MTCSLQMTQNQNNQNYVGEHFLPDSYETSLHLTKSAKANSLL